MLNSSSKENIFEKAFGFIGKGVNFAFNVILFPFESALAGMFERMGEVQVQDFAEGFNKNFQRALGLSFEETGGDLSKLEIAIYSSKTFNVVGKQTNHLCLSVFICGRF